MDDTRVFVKCDKDKKIYGLCALACCCCSMLITKYTLSTEVVLRLPWLEAFVNVIPEVAPQVLPVPGLVGTKVCLEGAHIHDTRV